MQLSFLMSRSEQLLRSHRAERLQHMGFFIAVHSEISRLTGVQEALIWTELEGLLPTWWEQSFSVNSGYHMAEQLLCIRSRATVSGHWGGALCLDDAIVSPVKTTVGEPGFISHLQLILMLGVLRVVTVWSHFNLCCGQFVTIGAFYFKGKNNRELLQVLCSLWWEAQEGRRAVVPQGSGAWAVRAVTPGWASGTITQILATPNQAVAIVNLLLKSFYSIPE